MDNNVNFGNFEPEKEYIQSLELSVQMLQREISLLRAQQVNYTSSSLIDIKYLTYLKDLSNSNNLESLKTKLGEIFQLLLSIFEFDLYLYDNRNILKRSRSSIQSILDDKLIYLEEEGIIDWAVQNDNFTIIKDLNTNSEEKDIYIYIIPIKLNNQIKGVLVLSSPNSKESLTEESINVINQLTVFLSLAVDNIESNLQINNMNQRLQSLNHQFEESSYMASISGILKSMIIEIQQPLLIMESNFKIIESGIDREQKRFDIINEQLMKLNGIYDYFRKLTNKNAKDIEKINTNISELLLDSLGMIGSQLKREGISFEVDISDNDIYILCFPTQLGHAIINIVMFLASRSLDIGSITITLSRGLRNQVVITFIDNGVGLSDEELSYLQYPESSDLSMPNLVEMQYIYKVIELNNGKVFINSEVNKGTSIKLIFTIVK
ncbi:MAG TPA: hypothetical protein PLE30_04135 [Candidatus Kapabacteria bacterium]|nr:hypothetical protein [Candidatus Kapabacteria bacterium]